MKKLLFVLALALPALFVSCGGDDDEPTPPPPINVLVGTSWADRNPIAQLRFDFYEPYKIKRTLNLPSGNADIEILEYTIQRRDPVTGAESELRIESPTAYQYDYISINEDHLIYAPEHTLRTYTLYKIP